MSSAKKPVDGRSRALLGRIARHRRIQPGPDTMSRREWGRHMAELISGLAHSGISQIAVPQWLPASLAAGVERERVRVPVT